MKNRTIFFLFISFLIIPDLFAGETKKSAGPRNLRPQLAGDTISEEVLAKLRSNTRNQSLGLNKAAGSVVPDTVHTELTTYDFGWNSPTRTMIKKGWIRRYSYSNR